MTLPNRLTIGRLGLTVLFVACFSLPIAGRYGWALGLFLVAVVTDYLDGEIARRWSLTTDFGKLMDPLADKILTASAFICLLGVEKGGTAAITAWAVIVIVSREFLITGLRLLASSKGIILPAERLGKHKTAWQMITILYFLTLLAIFHYLPPHWAQPAWNVGAYGLVPITVLLTIYSGAAYMVKNRHLVAHA